MMTPRLRLAGVLASGLLVALLTSSYVFMKIATFSVGLAFFGDPLIQRGIQYLNREYPHWKELSQLQKYVFPQPYPDPYRLTSYSTLLKGVPTNAQLTLTLLRIGEANAAPLPPPPSGSVEKAPSQPASIDHDKLKLGAAPDEIDRAVAPEPEDPNMHQQEKAESAKQKKGFGAKLLSFFRGTTAAGIESKLAISHARAEIGNLHAKNQKGVLRKKGLETLPMGPVEFDARYQGHRGMAIIDSSHEPALLYFTTDETAQLGDYRMESRKNGSVYFDIPVSDIKEMRKIGGMGWKGKLVTGWAVGGKEVVDGILVKGKHPHQEFQLTAVTKRDELFNRLVAIDGQVWNSF